MSTHPSNNLKSNFDHVFFRGTANDWETSEMALVADNTWQTTVTFGDSDFERFKFDIDGDWSHNYGDTNNDRIAERNGKSILVDSGEYKITFNDRTLQYQLERWSGGSAIIEFEDVDDAAEIENLPVICSNGKQYRISNNRIEIRDLAVGKYIITLDFLVAETRYWLKKSFDVTKEEPAITESYKVKTVSIPHEYQRLFDHNNFHRIELRLSRDEWNGMMKDMTTHKERFGNLRTGNYREASFVYDGPAYGGKQVAFGKVGLRTKGNSSRAYPQDLNGNYHRVHWKVKLDEFDHDQNFASLDSLILRHNSGDKSQMRELYVYDLFNRTGVYAPKTAPARLYFRISENDGSESVVYYGVYTILEPVDKHFLTKRFGKKDNDGNLYKCRKREEYHRGAASLGRISDKRMVGIKDWRKNYTPSYDLQTNEDKADHSILFDFVKNLNSLEGDRLKDFLKDHVHMDMFVRFLAMQKLVGATDEYLTNGNNFMIYFDEDDELTFIPLDYDNCLGRGWTPFDMARSNIYEMTFRDEPVLATKVLSVDKFKREYEEYLREFITQENGLFVYSDYEKRYDKLNNIYTHRSNGESHDYLINDTVSEHKMVNESEVGDYFHARTRSVLRQLGLSFDGYETN